MGSVTNIKLKTDQINPNRKKIIEKAILPIKNGTTIGRSTAIELAMQPKNVVLMKNQNRLDENDFE
ncbi:hypothetical protein CXF78_15205 [Shewanella sp. 11B5]|nr:hypothetical protein CXF78_15205 [Shewanella sp. 11B5]